MSRPCPSRSQVASFAIMLQYQLSILTICVLLSYVDAFHPVQLPSLPKIGSWDNTMESIHRAGFKKENCYYRWLSETVKWSLGNEVTKAVPVWDVCAKSLADDQWWNRQSRRHILRSHETDVHGRHTEEWKGAYRVNWSDWDGISEYPFLYPHLMRIEMVLTFRRTNAILITTTKIISDPS